jgi:hypothetical protein
VRFLEPGTPVLSLAQAPSGVGLEHKCYELLGERLQLVAAEFR